MTKAALLPCNFVNDDLGKQLLVLMTVWVRT